MKRHRVEPSVVMNGVRERSGVHIHMGLQNKLLAAIRAAAGAAASRAAGVARGAAAAPDQGRQQLTPISHLNTTLTNLLS